jgi:hypothetical protein
MSYPYYGPSVVPHAVRTFGYEPLLKEMLQGLWSVCLPSFITGCKRKQKHHLSSETMEK